MNKETQIYSLHTKFVNITETSFHVRLSQRTRREKNPWTFSCIFTLGARNSQIYKTEVNTDEKCINLVIRDF